MSNSRPLVERKTSTYETPAPSPSRAAFTPRGPERVYEERKPSKYDSDDYFGGTRSASRKHEDYERHPARKAAPRDAGEGARVVGRERRESERLSRTDKRRTRDQDTKRERERKYSAYDDDDDSDGDFRYEAERRRRTTEDTAKEREGRDRDERERERARVERDRERERGRERDEYEREKTLRRGYEKTTDHYSRMEEGARAYTGREKRPPLSRSASTTAKPEVYVDPSTGRPSGTYIRRPSSKPTTAPPPPPPPPPQMRRDRDRKTSVTDVYDTPDDRPATRPTTLHTSTSSPSAIKVPRPPSRATSVQVDDRHSHVPLPGIRRSETMPSIPARHPKESKREADYSTGPPTPTLTPDYVPSPTYKAYYYPDSSSREDVDHRRDHDRERRIHHSPDPMIRPPKPSPRYAAAPPPPPIRTNQSYSGTYATESPTSYMTTRPSPVRRDTQRDYESTPRAKYDYPSERIVNDKTRDHDRERRRGSPTDIETSFKKASQSEDVRGYSSRRGGQSSSSASAPRPRMPRDYSSYSARPQQAV
jgi:hypothetical protein